MEHKKRRKLTVVSTLHYVRLVYRVALFVVAAIVYIIYRVKNGESIPQFMEDRPMMVFLIWAVFVIEMAGRFIPSKLESPGCQKQFERNYVKSGSTEIKIQDNNATFLVALLWIGFNGIFGFLKLAGILDDGIMILLCCAFSVCDMICILFFCPFQTWFLKNKCCATCRIYNWDYIMMFTPLFFVKGAFSWSLLIMAFALLVRWEIAVYKYPERFSPDTNEYLQCANCTEKLCTHKRQLKTHWVALADFTKQRITHLSK